MALVVRLWDCRQNALRLSLTCILVFADSLPKQPRTISRRFPGQSLVVNARANQCHTARGCLAHVPSDFWSCGGGGGASQEERLAESLQWLQSVYPPKPHARDFLNRPGQGCVQDWWADALAANFTAAAGEKEQPCSSFFGGVLLLAHGNCSFGDGRPALPCVLARTIRPLGPEFWIY